MSDLQCAARVFLVARGAAEDPAAHLAAERIAAVLHAEVADDVALAGMLGDLIDSYRGESVVVVADGAQVGAVVARLTGAAVSAPEPGEVLRIDGDADGWSLR